MHQPNCLLVVQALVDGEHGDDGNGLIRTCVRARKALVGHAICLRDVPQGFGRYVAGTAEVFFKGEADCEEDVEVLESSSVKFYAGAKYEMKLV